nr:SdrD B-like domain-containing protein [Arcanobacterium pluranimalium]
MPVFIIGDLVWGDLNGNGVQEMGEPGFIGVTVSVTHLDGSPVINPITNTPIDPVVTDDFGMYSIVIPFDASDPANTSPEATQFIVHFRPPDGYVPTTVNSGDPMLDSNGSDALVNSLTFAKYEDNSIDAGFIPEVKMDVTTTDATGRAAPSSSMTVEVDASAPSVDLVHKVTNTGKDELLVKNPSYQVLANTSGVIGKNLNCDFSALGEADSSDYVGILPVGDSFTCTSQINDISTTEHISELTVDAVGVWTNKDIVGRSEFHAIVPRSVPDNPLPENLPENPITGPVPTTGNPDVSTGIATLTGSVNGSTTPSVASSSVAGASSSQLTTTPAPHSVQGQELATTGSVKAGILLALAGCLFVAGLGVLSRVKDR